MSVVVNSTTTEPVDAAGRRALSLKLKPLHALDNPDIWRQEPAYQAPSNVDIIQAQKWIDSMMGVTRDNQSIYKLVWNGDRRYWYQFYMRWNGLGQPVGAVTRRPQVRYKALRNRTTKKLIRDVFPPRWLIMTRLEPEQYAGTWKQESYVFSHEINAYKQIRPDVPPKVVWLWYSTIADHSDYCCATAEKNQVKCYGKYAGPHHARELLEAQRAADLRAGMRSVYEQVDPTFVSEMENERAGYLSELEQLKIEAHIFMENPMALIGLQGSLRTDMSLKQARQRVKEYFDNEQQKLARLI